MKGLIVTIGDEILIGQITDTNSAWLGNALSQAGIDVVGMMTISDKIENIHQTLDLALSRADIIIMTGGLGPTKDDITKKALAEYFDSDMYLDEPLKARISGYFEKRGIPFLEAHEAQCYMPTKAQNLFNKMGTAPGMFFSDKGRYVLSMPGVPYEMKWIFENSFLPVFETINTDKKHIYHKTIRTVGMGESRIAGIIEDILVDLPSDISMSYLPSIGEVKLRLTARSLTDKSHIVDAYVEKIAARIPELVFGYDKTTLAESLQGLFIENGMTLSTAESCTGGFLAHKLTQVSGSSGYYMGSIIAYDYAPKRQLLNVQNTTLEQTGAVSEETVKEMLAGVLEKFGTDVGVAISGIAGPGGGLPDKPVGTIWLAFGSSKRVETKKLQLAKDRQLNIEYTAVAAMNALRKFVKSTMS